MIIRVEKNKNYTVMSNVALKDDTLPLDTLGLWAWLMSKPDTWDISVNGIVSQRKEGRDSVRRMLNELQKKGYLVKGEQKRAEAGKFGKPDWIMLEEPMTGNPTTVEPSTVRPTQVSTDKVNTDKVSISNDIPASSLMKTEKKVYGNPEVNQLIETFVSLTGLRLMKMTEQRRYGSLLIKANGLENCLAACAVVAAIMEDQYAPRISDLKTLYYKFGDLQLYARKQQPKETKKPQDLDEL